MHFQSAWSGYIKETLGFFQNGWEYISANNLRMLKRSSTIAAGMIAVFLLFAHLNHNSAAVRIAYAIGLIFDGFFCVSIHLNQKRLRWRTRVIQWLCVLYLLEMFTLIVYTGTLGSPNMPGIFFAPFILVLSMVFIFHAWQNAALFSAATAAFLWLSHLSKTPELFQLDWYIGAVTWILTLIVNFEILHMRLRDYHLRLELEHRSSTDGLTGLMNKSAAEASARCYLSRRGARESSALFVIDLDQFKQINDLLGHKAGDQALEVVGDALTKLFRSQDVIGRVGGDEFVVLMKNVCERKLIARRAASICNTVRHTRLRESSLSLTCSIGIAVCPTHGATYDDLFRKADEQLYLVKRSGKDGFMLAR